MMITWREEINKAFTKAGDSSFNSKSNWCYTIGKPLKLDNSVDRPFDPSYGGINGPSFTAWGKYFVYFPVCYDGSEWVGYVARHPNNIPTPHIGGG